MLALTRAIKFSILSAQERIPEVQFDELVVPSAERNYKTDRYRPLHKKPFATLVFTHGMSRLAHRDPRLINTAKRLVALGYEVLVPLFPEVQALDIGPNIKDDFLNCFTSIIREKLCINDHFSIVAASFSVAQVVRVIGQPALAQHITAMLAFGGNFSYSDSLAFLLREQGTKDIYCRTIVLRHVLKNTAPKHYTSDIETVLSKIIDDNFEDNVAIDANQYCAALNEQDKQFLFPYVNNLLKLDELWRKNIVWIEGLDEQFNHDAHIENITSPISLIHSQTDGVVEPIESEKTYQWLKDNGVPCRLVITPLLDHVEHNFSLKLFPDLLRLLAGFYYFFKSAK